MSLRLAARKSFTLSSRDRLQLHLDALTLALLLWIREQVQQGIERIMSRYKETA